MDGHRGPATRHRLGSVMRCAAGAVALVGLLGGCGTQHPTVAELRALPGATSAYPGSVAVYGQGAREGEHTLVNSSGAELFTIWCTRASLGEVTSWFSAELERQGWEAVLNPVGTTSTSVVETLQWTLGERLFTLEILTSTYVADLSASRGQPCSSAYRTDVQ